jgi:glutathione synthase/RimK-type ligase-like ATP-grasp enzyme
MADDKQVLILTNMEDPHTDAAIALLNRRGRLKPVRINSNDFVNNTDYTFQWNTGAVQTARNVRLIDSGLSLTDVSVGWWRKPQKISPPPNVSDSEATRFVQEENDTLVRCLPSIFPEVKWVNSPRAMSGCGRKLDQLPIAKTLGFKVPQTIVSNSRHEILSFLDVFPDAIIKPMDFGGFTYDNKNFGCFTSPIGRREVEGLPDSAFYAPVFVQRKIVKFQELRVTVIGSKVSACAIDSQGSDDLSVRSDWRMIPPVELPHQIVNLPDDITSAVRRFTEICGLNYAAFDIIQEPDKEFYFLEMNPNGQYLWIEHLTGEPLTLWMVELIEALAIDI